MDRRDPSSSLRKVEGALESVGRADVDGVKPYVVVDGVGMGVGGGEQNTTLLRRLGPLLEPIPNRHP